MERVAREWLKTDAAAARIWLEHAPLSAELKLQLVNSFSTSGP